MEENPILINKLFLIGNGFDLSLGLKTDYKSFIHWYFKNALLKTCGTQYRIFSEPGTGREIYGYFSDEFIEIKFTLRHLHYINNGKLIKFQSYIDEIEEFDEIKDILTGNKSKRWGIELIINSSLLEKIFDSLTSNWVDIEWVYYELLKEYFNNDSDNIDQLNSELEILVKYLTQYLESINTNVFKPLSKRIPYFDQFRKQIELEDVISQEISQNKFKLHQLYFLNFNYTDSINKLLKPFYSRTKIKTIINPIHGQLNDPNSPIIFGYGDEMDADFKELVDSNDNRYLKNIKSFQYFRNQNYRNLLSFLDSGFYQVCIYGHSCGLSDRIMLNEIFEHNNCISIKIYHYENDKGENDFVNKSMEISRHFNNNLDMRRKIVNFNPSELIPQL